MPVIVDDTVMFVNFDIRDDEIAYMQLIKLAGSELELQPSEILSHLVLRSAISFKGDLLLVGGLSAEGEASTQVSILDPSTRKYSEILELKEPRIQPPIEVNNERLFVGFRELEPLSSFEIICLKSYTH